MPRLPAGSERCGQNALCKRVALPYESKFRDCQLEASSMLHTFITWLRGGSLSNWLFLVLALTTIHYAVKTYINYRVSNSLAWLLARYG